MNVGAHALLHGLNKFLLSKFDFTILVVSNINALLLGPLDSRLIEVRNELVKLLLGSSMILLNDCLVFFTLLNDVANNLLGDASLTQLTSSALTSQLEHLEAFSL